MLELVLFLGILPALLNANGEGKEKPDAEASDSFINDVLERHNYYRAKHGVGALTIDPKLNSAAQEWADKIKSTDSMKHNRELIMNEQVGENLAKADPAAWQTVTGSMYVDSWYQEEAKIYTDSGYCLRTDNSAYPPQDTRHFTQIVWKDTTHIGVGKAGNYLVVNYYPRGNILGQFLEMVPCPID